MDTGNDSVMSYNASFSGVEQVIYGSVTEQIVSLVFLFIPALVTLVTQLLVILTVVFSPALHDAHFYIMVACCVADLLVMMMSTGNLTLMFTKGQQEWFCRGQVMSSIVTGSFLGNTLKVAVIAYERFVYFVQPYQYLQRFTPRRLAAYVAAPYVMSILWIVVTNYTHGREYHASTLNCSLPNRPFLRVLHTALFFAPPTIVSIFTIVRVLRLTRNVSPEAPSASAPPVKQIRRAVRMLLLLSGAFWFSVLPGHLVNTVVFVSGSTWDDVDSRRHFIAAILIRISSWLYVCFPPAINPAIYLYSRKDLRTAMLRKLCRNNQINAENTSTTASS